MVVRPMLSWLAAASTVRRARPVPMQVGVGGWGAVSIRRSPFRLPWVAVLVSVGWSAVQGGRRPSVALPAGIGGFTGLRGGRVGGPCRCLCSSGQGGGVREVGGRTPLPPRRLPVV